MGKGNYPNADLLNADVHRGHP